MKIRLDKIGDEPLEWREETSLSAASLEREQLLELGPIESSGRVWIESPGYCLEAKISYDQTVACDRCLAPIVQTIESDVRLTLVVGSPERVEEEIELTQDDLETLYVTEEELDTREIVREQVQLNVPMRILCKQDCRGLCPNCGVNRNHESCECEQAPTDPRWEVLRGLKH